jgi:hypothetical protein
MKYFKAVNYVSFIALIAVSLFIGMLSVPRAEAATKVHQVSTLAQLVAAIADAETNNRPDDIVVKGDTTYALTPTISTLEIEITDGKKVVIRKKPKSTAMPVLDGGGSDGVFLIKQGEVELRNLKITKGSESFGGGILVEDSDVNLRLVDCLIDDNHADGGGGILNQGGTIEIIGSTISNNSAGYTGGGIYNGSDGTTGGTIIIRSGTVIEKNEILNLFGGGICNGDGDTITDTLEISSSIIRDNIAHNFTGGGGGIFNNKDGDLTIRLSSLIDSNDSGKDGGGIENRGKITIRGGSQVINNTASSSGGGIHNLGADADLTLLDSVVSDNTADEFGGGILNAVYAQLTIKGGLIRNNTADIVGGGISNSGEATATITHGTSIIDNTASDDGGGVWNDDASLTIENDCLIRHNTASDEGGGIFNSSDSTSIVTLKDMAITFNTALTAGGGIYNGNAVPGALTCINIINNATNTPDACAPAANCPLACAP